MEWRYVRHLLWVHKGVQSSVLLKTTLVSCFYFIYTSVYIYIFFCLLLAAFYAVFLLFYSQGTCDCHPFTWFVWTVVRSERRGYGMWAVAGRTSRTLGPGRGPEAFFCCCLGEYFLSFFFFSFIYSPRLPCTLCPIFSTCIRRVLFSVSASFHFFSYFFFLLFGV